MSVAACAPNEDWKNDLIKTLPPMLTRRAAAAALSISTKSVDRRVREKALTAVRCGRRTLIARASVIDFLAANSNRS